MKITVGYPPNIEAIKKKFKIHDGVVFTYGDTLYSPKGFSISPELFQHEAIHTKQQGDDPKGWWDRYLVDDKFRLEQELEAYRKQYRALKAKTKDRNYLFNYAKKLASDMSSALYGNIIGFIDAYAYITAK